MEEVTVTEISSFVWRDCWSCLLCYRSHHLQRSGWWHVCNLQLGRRVWKSRGSCWPKNKNYSRNHKRINSVPILIFTYSLEVWSNSEDFVDQIFGGLDTNVSNVFVNDSVVREGDSLAVDLAVSALVDQFTDSLQVWITPGDEWLSIRISTSNRIKRF